jgi:hypothetical protein
VTYLRHCPQPLQSLRTHTSVAQQPLPDPRPSILRRSPGFAKSFWPPRLAQTMRSAKGSSWTASSLMTSTLFKLLNSVLVWLRSISSWLRTAPVRLKNASRLHKKNSSVHRRTSAKRSKSLSPSVTVFSRPLSPCDLVCAEPQAGFTCNAIPSKSAAPQTPWRQMGA